MINSEGWDFALKNYFFYPKFYNQAISFAGLKHLVIKN